MLPILPPEMLAAIFERMDAEEALLNVMLASRHCFRMAEPILYSRVFLQFPSFRRSSSGSKSDRLESFLDALTTSDGRRASYVRALTFPTPHYQRKDEPALIEKILTMTVNLKALRLQNFPLHPFPSRQLAQFTPTCFHVTCIFLFPEIQRFLESQTSLETIHLQLAMSSPSSTSRAVFSSTSFPNLKTLVVNFCLIPAFLRTSACVRNLRVIARDHDNSMEDLVRMPSVRTFSCRSEYTRRSLVWRLPNLEWLELSGPTNISTLMRRSYESHTLRGILVERFTSPPPYDFRSLFNAIPTLEFVEYRYRVDIPPERWYRGATCPTSVRWLCSPGDEWLVDWERTVVIAPLGITETGS